MKVETKPLMAMQQFDFRLEGKCTSSVTLFAPFSSPSDGGPPLTLIL